MTLIPDSHQDLVERPLFAHLATIRPDGTPQVNPMWFTWDGEHLLFTNTTTRYKYRNVVANPAVSVSINDPDAPYRYLEIRGIVERIDPDRTGAFFLELAKRYQMTMDGPPPDVADRVVYRVRPTGGSHQ
jgi:PPOX class probable F420-dependent enzyme